MSRFIEKNERIVIYSDSEEPLKIINMKKIIKRLFFKFMMSVERVGWIIMYVSDMYRGISTQKQTS